LEHNLKKLQVEHDIIARSTTEPGTLIWPFNFLWY